MSNFSDMRIRLLVLFLVLVAGFYFFQFPSKQFASILYPNTGGTFDIGKPLEIRWTSGSPGIQEIQLISYVDYQKYNNPYGYYGDRFVIYYKQEYAYHSTGGDISGSYFFTPSAYQVPPGSYYVRIVGANNSGKIDVSDTPITLIAPQTAPITASSVVPTPFSYPSSTPQAPATPVKVISPNGGETFTVDGSIRISWMGGKNKVWVGVAKGDYQPGTGDSHMGWITQNAVPNSFVFWDGNICVTPEYCRPVTYWQPSGSVKILVVSENNDGDICIWADRPCNLDVSDAPFIIKPRSLLPLALPSPSLTHTTVTPQPEKTPLSPTPSIKNIVPSARSAAPKINKSSSSNGTPLLTIISPNGGEAFKVGSPMKISWSSENAPADMLVNIYLFSKNLEEHKDYVWTANVASYARNTGTMNWRIPQDIKLGGNYFLRIGCQYPQGALYQGCMTDDNNNAFSISNGTSPVDVKIEQQAVPIEEKIVSPPVSSEERSATPQGLWARIKAIFGF